MACLVFPPGRRLLALAVMGAGLAATAALGQPAAQTGAPTLPKLQPQKPIGAVRVPENKVALKKSAAVPHKPFELKDAQGKPIDPNQKVTLPDGKQVTAREYVDELNQIEKALNAIGHSLRNRNAVPASLAVDKALFDRQAEQAKKSFHKLGAPAVKAPRMTAALVQKREAEVKELMTALKGPDGAAPAAGKNPAKPTISPDVLSPPTGGAGTKPAGSGGGLVTADRLKKDLKNVVKKDPPLAETYRSEVVEQSRRRLEGAKQKAIASNTGFWGTTFGDRGLFATDMAVNMNVHSEMDGNGDHHKTTMLAMTQGGGYIVGQRVDVFRAAALVTTDHQQTSKLHLQIDLFGKTTTNQDVGPGEGDANTANMDFHVGPIEIPIGPFFVTGEYLLRAKVGMHYILQVDAGRAILEVMPNVSSTLGHWRGGGVGIKGAKIGAAFGGTLTWINQQLYLRGEAVKAVEKPSYRRTLTVSTHGHNNFESLAGTMEVKGKVSVPLLGDAEGTLAKTTWPGFRFGGVIFDGRKVEYPR